MRDDALLPFVRKLPPTCAPASVGRSVGRSPDHRALAAAQTHLRELLEDAVGAARARFVRAQHLGHERLRLHVRAVERALHHVQVHGLVLRQRLRVAVDNVGVVHAGDRHADLVREHSGRWRIRAVFPSQPRHTPRQPFVHLCTHTHAHTFRRVDAAQERLDAAAGDLLRVEAAALLVDEEDAGRGHARLAALGDAARLLHEPPVGELAVEHRQAVALLHALLHDAWAAGELRLVHFLRERVYVSP
ncbi:hypothetical protein PybrP1_003879 [[Pythium] brassicae (nom. inval.)]|nr:hypothetical protein PybrP1_003879 [[Pythium] brassicae (nom. inval.)]